MDGGDALPDIRGIAPQLTDYATDRRLFLELAEAALADGDLRRAAFHVRAAQFFVRGDDPDRQPLRARFVELLLRSRGMDDRDRDRIPFGDGWLPAYRFDAGEGAIAHVSCAPRPDVRRSRSSLWHDGGRSRLVPSRGFLLTLGCRLRLSR